MLLLVACVAGAILLVGCDSLGADCKQQCDTIARVNDELGCETRISTDQCLENCRGADTSASCNLKINDLIDCQDDAPIAAWECADLAGDNPTFNLSVDCNEELGDLLQCLSEN